MIKLTGFSVAIMLLLNLQLAWGQYYTFKKYNHRNGLNTEATLCSAQDKNGYILIGTDGGGLMQFDGNNFSEIGRFGSSNALHISSIATNSKNEIYFSTLFDGIYSLKNGQYKFIYKPTSLGDSRNLYELDSNLVLVSDLEIQLISKKGKLLKQLKRKGTDMFQVIQALKVHNTLILLTNQGNYAVHRKSIIPLESWLSDHTIPKDINFAIYQKNRLIFYHNQCKDFTEVSFSNFGSAVNSTKGKTQLKTTFTGTVKLVAERNGKAFLLTEENQLLKFSNNTINHIHINTPGEFFNFSGMMLDNTGILWMNNSGGVYKIYQETFTKVVLFNEALSNTISFYHRIESTGQDLFNIPNDGFYISSIKKKEIYKTYPINVFGISESPYGIFLATNEGIKQLKGNNLTDAHFPYIGTNKASMIFYDGENFWYGEADNKLYRYSLKTKQSKVIVPETKIFPRFFYSAQVDFAKKNVYFGTNNGVWKYNKKSQKFTQLTRFNHLGSYSGNSVKDKYGTIWFTLDKAIIGITKSEEYVSISDPKKLPSTLFYTLNSDQYGNLLVGTNKGINVIKVDALGHVVNQRNYSYFEGFGGYETNMRASYQKGNLIYVGTIEGLFQINTSILENYPVPPKPQIIPVKQSTLNSEYQNNQLSFSFKCILPKSTGISYSYRVIGYSDKWSNLTTSNKLVLPELENGYYTLEVRATYDGINFSPTGIKSIIIENPIYKNKWFIVLIVVLIGLLNIAFLEWSKSYSSSKMVDTNVLAIDIHLIPRLLVFSILITIGLPFIVNAVQQEIHIDSWFITIQTAILVILYSFTRIALYRNVWLNFVVVSAYATYAAITLGSFFLIYQTKIHPYPVLQLCIITSVLPFLISRIRIVTLICISQILLGFCLIIMLDETKYNEVLFLVAVTVSSALVVIFSYVRLDSLEKLVFVNGLLNRGNVISVSFDENGIITYCSANISDYFKFESAALIGKSTSVFNEVVLDENIRESKITEMFVDGKAINIPMIDKHGKMIWIEWICKEISGQVRVIMGQDVTEKLTISNNYQSLVENAKDLIFNTDIHGNFLFVNEYTKKLLGYRAESLIGKNSLSLVVPEYAEYVEKFYRTQFEDGIKYTYLEYPIRNKEGKIFWLGQNLTLVYEPGSREKISGFIVLARDITERRANDLLLEQQNKEIASGINSAKRIQFNLLPKKEVFSLYFEESFVFFKPKDIVSGDFYWIERVENKVIVALADCTGHGISGAFLTILGFNLLNQIVLERKIMQSSEIISEMSKAIASALKVDTLNFVNDEMDLLVLVFEDNKLDFSSSGVGLIHISDGQINQIKNTFSKDRKTVQKQEITLKENDQLYLLTDGYPKQFGALAGKKFGSKRIIELLEKIQTENLNLQKKYVENTIRNWSEGHEQTDDITFIGLKNFRLPS